MRGIQIKQTRLGAGTDSGWKKVLAVAASSALVLAFAGCGLSTVPFPSDASNTIQASALKGTVMGGQQPVGGVTVQLYQAGTTGYGSAATKLGVSVQTTPSGNFNLPSYACTPGTQVYLVGTGGQPIAGTTNSNLAMIVGLGNCGGLNLNTFINVNELTTVATIWALSPFMTSYDHIGTTATNTLGLQNAFAAITELVDTTDGATPGPTLPANGSFSTTLLNTLGDILEQCINSGGGAAPDKTNCGKLFTLATNASGVHPTDTITAMMNIAQNPGHNVSSLNQLRSASPVFQPVLSVNSPPTAWTIALTYTGSGLNAPSSIAADANGYIWLTNSAGNSVSKFSNTGASLGNYTSGGINAPSAIAIDASGNAWVTNSGNNSLTRLNSAGVGTAYTGNGLNAPSSISIDGAGELWITNSGASTVSAFTSTGAVLTGSPFSGAGITTPVSVTAAP